MDDLGKRLIRDWEVIAQKRARANELEKEARTLRQEADEIQRLAELARFDNGRITTPPISIPLARNIDMKG